MPRIAKMEGMKTVRLQAAQIEDWDSFHGFFRETFGFPPFYRHSMRDWIDCMSFIPDPRTKMTTLTIEPGDCLVLEVEDADTFRARQPEIFNALTEAVLTVNQRLAEYRPKGKTRIELVLK